MQNNLKEKLVQFPNNASDFRVPPQDLEMEQSVLGSMMLSAEAVRTVVPICKAEDFYREAHRTIYQAIITLDDRKEPVDVMTLTNELRRMGEFETVGGVPALSGLVERVPTAANAEYYAQIVKEKAYARRLIAAAMNVVADAYEDAVPIKELLDSAEHRIFEATHIRQSKGFSNSKALISEQYDYINKVAQHKLNVEGVPSGFDDLDNLTSGLQPSELIVIGARPSIGKTALALDIARNATIGTNILKSKTPIGFFSLEMTDKQLMRRMLCATAKVDLKKVRAGYLNDQDRARLSNAANTLYESKIHINDSSSLTVLELKSYARRLKQSEDIGLLIVDYLQLILPGASLNNREQEIAFISRNLKALAKELDIPVIALSQLSRPPKGSEARKPVLSDLRESGAIEQDADVVIFIHKEQETEDVVPTYELVVAKQRNGPVDNIPVVFQREFTTFRSASRMSNDEREKTEREKRREWAD